MAEKENTIVIRIKGKRSFQVALKEVVSGCRKVNDNASNPLGYLDPGWEYEVKESFGKEMCRRYPADCEVFGSPRRYEEAPSSKASTEEKKEEETPSDKGDKTKEDAPKKKSSKKRG